MNIADKTILITGGGSGIGLEIAKLLSQKGNKVMITGRNESKLKEASARLNNVSFFAADIDSETDVDRLFSHISEKFGGLDILINNAAQLNVYKLSAGNAYDTAAAEMQTNFLSVIRLTEKLLPFLTASKEAAIINVSSIVAFVPGVNIPGYSASKAALHSYTQSLRFMLGLKTGIKVFELMPPMVDTEFSAGIGGAHGIAPEVVAEGLIEGLEKDEYELHIGNTADMYELFRRSPREALSVLNQRK